MLNLRRKRKSLEGTMLEILCLFEAKFVQKTPRKKLWHLEQRLRQKVVEERNEGDTSFDENNDMGESKTKLKCPLSLKNLPLDICHYCFCFPRVLLLGTADEEEEATIESDGDFTSRCEL